MSNTDPIADMITRIRNAAAVRKTSVSLPHSKMKQTVAEVLKGANFIDDVSVSGEGVAKELVLVLNANDTNARISTIERMSTPGRRMYVAADEIPTVRQGRGIVIISTSNGVMTGTEAKAKRLGGELICKVS
jgi:small subunit ribosomal protein S8